MRAVRPVPAFVGPHGMKPALVLPPPEAEARLLLLIDGFTSTTKSLEGRTKLAKLDFFLRYPVYLQRALALRSPNYQWPEEVPTEATVDTRMIRYRYGPWDPSYFATLGRLIGKGLVRTVSDRNGISFQSTPRGRELAQALCRHENWEAVRKLILLERRHLDLSGTSLKNFIYEHFPEISTSKIGDPL